MNKPGRPPRLPTVFPTAASPVYFVTICAANRQSLFANTPVQEVWRKFAESGQRKFAIAVGRYVLMPDHIHLFVCGPVGFDLAQWVRMLKTVVGKRLRESGSTAPIWQRGFFDHMLRSEESYGKKWEYVRQNPVRAGLVARAEDWPYQGEIVVIDRV